MSHGLELVGEYAARVSEQIEATSQDVTSLTDAKDALPKDGSM